MVLDTEKQVDDSIASLLKECAESDEDGLGGVLKVVTVLAEFMDMDNTMEVLNGLLYHDNEKIALNSLAIFRHLRETGDINLQPIELSRIEDGEEFVEPIDEEETFFDEAAMVPEMEEEVVDAEVSEGMSFEEIQPEDIGEDVSEETPIAPMEVSGEDLTLEMEPGYDESMVEPIPEFDISPQQDDAQPEETVPEEFELQVPEISTFIPIGETGEEEENIEEYIIDEIPGIGVEETPVTPVDIPETSPFDMPEETSPFGDIEPESP
ncbi:MAG: hypothetical protein KAH86_09990, partial [Methanosarcinales archaeon]|nr:hypothetical protein [Methanosarcinales archaeon]